MFDFKKVYIINRSLIPH